MLFPYNSWTILWLSSATFTEKGNVSFQVIEEDTLAVNFTIHPPTRVDNGDGGTPSYGTEIDDSYGYLLKAIVAPTANG